MEIREVKEIAVIFARQDITQADQEWRGLQHVGIKAYWTGN